MRVLVRLSALAAVGLGAVLLACWLLVPWLGGPALFDGALGDLLDLVWAEQVRAGAIDVRSQSTRACLEGKHQVDAELAAGRMTLAEAADRFRELGALVNDGQDSILGPYPGVPDTDEDIYRNVILWTQVCHRDTPERERQLVERLKQELARLLTVRKRIHH
jgi:hypothetical protein